MSHNNDSVRNKLLEITNQVLMLKAIALNVGIDVDALKEADMRLLADYLNIVYIPRWNGEKPKPEKKKSTRDLLFM